MVLNLALSRLSFGVQPDADSVWCSRIFFIVELEFLLPCSEIGSAFVFHSLFMAKS